MARKTVASYAVLGLALIAPAEGARKTIPIPGVSLVARYDMDVNIACDPSATQLNRGFVEQQCSYFFPLSGPNLQGKFLGITLYARDDNAAYDIEARILRKKHNTEDAFDDPDTIAQVSTDDDDNDLRVFEGTASSSLQKIEPNNYFYYVQVDIPDVNLGVVGLQVRYDDKAK
jgi:hypothetical protein